MLHYTLSLKDFRKRRIARSRARITEGNHDKKGRKKERDREGEDTRLKYYIIVLFAWSWWDGEKGTRLVSFRWCRGYLPICLTRKSRNWISSCPENMSIKTEDLPSKPSGIRPTQFARLFPSLPYLSLSFSGDWERSVFFLIGGAVSLTGVFILRRFLESEILTGVLLPREIRLSFRSRWLNWLHCWRRLCAETR